MRVKRVHQPRPRHIRQQRIRTNVKLQRRLRKNNRAPRPTPRLRLIRIMQKHETPRPIRGVTMRIGPHISRKRNPKRRHTPRRSNLTHRKIRTKRHLPQHGRHGLKLGGDDTHAVRLG